MYCFIAILGKKTNKQNCGNKITGNENTLHFAHTACITASHQEEPHYILCLNVYQYSWLVTWSACPGLEPTPWWTGFPHDPSTKPRLCKMQFIGVAKNNIDAAAKYGNFLLGVIPLNSWLWIRYTHADYWSWKVYHCMITVHWCTCTSTWQLCMILLESKYLVMTLESKEL